MSPIEAIHQLGWRVEGAWIIIDGDGSESGQSLSLDDFERIVQLVTPQWRPGEWQQDLTVLRKYAVDEDGKVWIMDLPPLPA